MANEPKRKNPISISQIPDEKLYTVEAFDFWKNEDPGAFIAAIKSEIASRTTILEIYSKILFERIDLSEVEKETGLDTKRAIIRAVQALKAIVPLMQAYRYTLYDDYDGSYPLDRD
jgi:hypothetical protein